MILNYHTNLTFPIQGENLKFPSIHSSFQSAVHSFLENCFIERQIPFFRDWQLKMLLEHWVHSGIYSAEVFKSTSYTREKTAQSFGMPWQDFTISTNHKILRLGSKGKVIFLQKRSFLKQYGKELKAPYGHWVLNTPYRHVTGAGVTRGLAGERLAG